ncbi:MAG: glycyl-radical enzyme activating protein [Clostridia bacterium]
MTGMITKISRFCIQDGPGIRTTVFLKGCPLSCQWCHNPETINPSPELLYDREKCNLCRLCEGVCPTHCHSFEYGIHKIDLEKCSACGKCTVCPQKALSISGVEMSSEEIVKEVIKDSSFYETSDGGVTLSGGEPFFQAGFCREVLKALKVHGIHTCVETSGCIDLSTMPELIELIDLVLLDYKHSNQHLLKEFTGESQEISNQNLGYLCKINKQTILRCPIIPGVNDTKEHFDGILKVIQSYDNIIEVNLLPYHSLGESKYDQLQMSKQRSFAIPTQKQVDGWLNYLETSKRNAIKICAI